MCVVCVCDVCVWFVRVYVSVHVYVCSVCRECVMCICVCTYVCPVCLCGRRPVGPERNRGSGVTTGAGIEVYDETRPAHTGTSCPGEST